MKKYAAIPVSIVLLLSSIAGYGQEHLQPLERELENPALSTEERLTLYDDLSWEYLNYNFEKSVSYAQQGIELARKDANIGMETRLIRNLGVAYYMNRMYGEASAEYDRAMELAVLNKDENMQAALFFAIANMHNAMTDYEKAVENYIKAVELFEKTGNKPRVIAAKANMCSMYIGMRNYAVAEPLAKKVIALAEETGDEFTTGQGYNHLMIIYYAQEKDDECLEYARKAWKTYEELGVPLEVFTAMIQIGRVYVRQGKTAEALDIARQALDTAEQTGYEQYVVEAKEMLARIMLTGGKNRKEAEILALEALQEADTTDYRMMVNLSDLLLKIYIDKGDRIQAGKYDERKYHWLHRIVETDLANAAREMDIKYETEKKEARIETLNRTRRIYIVLFILCCAGIVLLISVLVLLNRYQRQKRLRMEEHLRQVEQEKELQSARALLHGETKERGRLSRELHDGLGGLLTMVKLALEKLRETPEIAAEKLAEPLQLIDKSVVELRRMSHNLMPEALARFGLRPVLAEFCATAPGVQFYFFGDECRFDADTETHLYRIACELINNALKHSGADQINVQLITSADRISLTVQDNGCGFDSSEAREGLTTIHSRASLLGAKIDIFSAKDKGSEITVELAITQKV